MTSEVVVMNSLGVALATDSATTVTVGRDNKVYNSADKLFMLSKRHPVGVMIYNNASLLGIPWETLLKMFRGRLGPQEFPTLEEYGRELLRFLDGNVHLFPEDVQYRFYLRLVETLYRGINKGIDTRILAQIRQGDDDPDREAIATKYILTSLKEWQGGLDDGRVDAEDAKHLASRGSADIRAAVDKAFGSHLKLGSDAVTALRELAILVVSKQKILDETRSGLVIAGFGRDEYFPVLQTFELGEVYRGKLKYHLSGLEKIDREKNLSVIKPFAQSEMVDTFLGGISTALKRRIIHEFVTLITELPDTIIDSIADLSRPKKARWKTIMKGHGEQAAIDLVQKLEQYRLNRHLTPIRNAITNLPKNELAHVAASLVNLNSFQKRMSPEPETVGGPVDVAVITKGDGFVWIERKHYFRPELNPHFFQKYGVRVEEPSQGDDNEGRVEEDEIKSDKAR